MFNDKSILITGGTGSFGKTAIRKILSEYRPKKLIVFSRDELKQFEMQNEFPKKVYDCMRYFLGDVRDLERMKMAMREVNIVIHAAALKQVPAAEYNPMECVKTNVQGAQNVIDASLECGVEKVIALSTDKAASPINLYGATKLVSDKLFVAGNQLAGERKTRFSVVRYGNVAGSRGSVIPYFRSLLEKGSNEIPITDERMTRFTITLEQGVQFVMDSFQRMHGGEVFVPKIPSMRITDLASVMAPGLHQKIVGIRPGEKLHEVMCPADVSHETLEFDNYYVIKPSIHWAKEQDFSKSAIGKVGHTVCDGFEYNSGSNPWFMSQEDIRVLLKSLYS